MSGTHLSSICIRFLPEIVVVDVLDGKPKAPVPLMIRGFKSADHPSGRRDQGVNTGFRFVRIAAEGGASAEGTGVSWIKE